VFGVHGHAEAAHITYLGLYALQHRGQESAGIVSVSAHEQHVHRGMGLVADVFNEEILKRLPGRHAIGHVRYSTAGGSFARNAQPFYASTDAGPVAIAHNGNLVNAGAIRRELEGRGSILTSTSDSEVIVHLLARSRETNPEDRLIDALSRVKGAYSLVMLTDDALVAARDPFGFRPLSLARLGGAWIVASETCAFDLIGAEFERDLEPGEVVVIRRGRLRTLRPFAKAPRQSFCIFEQIYFARPDSNVIGHSVYQFRKELGRILAREHPVAATWWCSCSTRATRRASGKPVFHETALIQPVREAHLHPTVRFDPRFPRAHQTQRVARWWAASASCWSRIRSCAAPPCSNWWADRRRGVRVRARVVAAGVGPCHYGSTRRRARN
jgi:amidophosphoribosyltransferase